MNTTVWLKTSDWLEIRLAVNVRICYTLPYTITDISSSSRYQVINPYSIHKLILYFSVLTKIIPIMHESFMLLTLGLWVSEDG
jgi:hypothetical protein